MRPAPLQTILLASLALSISCGAPPPEEPAAARVGSLAQADTGSCPISSDPSNLPCEVLAVGTTAVGAVSGLLWVESAVQAAGAILQWAGVLGSSNAQPLLQIEQAFETTTAENSALTLGYDIFHDASDLRQDLEYVAVRLQSNIPVLLTDEFYLTSQQQVANFWSNAAASLRLPSDAMIAGPWELMISARAPLLSLNGAGAYVYDWRPILPVLMTGIAIREAIIAAIVPTFRGDPRWACSGCELSDDARALKTIRDTIVDQGIQCGYGIDNVPMPPLFPALFTSDYNEYEFYCADIFSGIYAENKVANPNPWNGWLGKQPLSSTAIQNALDSTRRSLIHKLPLFMTQAMIDSVVASLSTGPDLTQEIDNTIRPSAASTLCLDTVGHATMAGTALQLAACNGSSTQRWHYNRTTQSIVHAASGLCVDVACPQSCSLVFGTVVCTSTGCPSAETPGAPAGLAQCSGSDSQKWTYAPNSDPSFEAGSPGEDDDRGILTSATGNVLDMGANAVVGEAVQYWPRNHSNGQRWMSPSTRQLGAMSDQNEDVALMSLASDLKSGTVTTVGALPAGAYLVGTGDFNGDGEGDILWRQGTNIFVWTLHNGSVVGGNQLLRGGVSWNWIVVGTGDFNGDGITAVAWRNALGGSNSIGIWTVTGPTSVTNYYYPPYSVSATTNVIGTGDFDGDGTTDLLLLDTATNGYWIWRFLNGQVADQGTTQTPSSGWSFAATGDFDGDGRTDILWRQSPAGTIGIWIMANENTIANYLYPGSMTDPSWSVKGTGDFDGDGTTDILWKQSIGGSATGLTSVWRMRGGSMAGPPTSPIGTTSFSMEGPVVAH